MKIFTKNFFGRKHIILRFSFFKSTLILFFISQFLSQDSLSQTTYFWRNDQNPTVNANWANSPTPVYWWRGDPEVPTGGEILSFDGNSTNMSSNNNLVPTNRYRIVFENTNTPGPRILNGSTTNTFFDFTGSIPAFINNSGQTHTDRKSTRLNSSHG